MYAQPIAAVSGAPVVLAAPAPRLGWAKKEVEWETLTIKKPKIKRVATPISGAAPVSPLLVQLPRRALPNLVVPTYVKGGVPTQAVIARKTLLPAKTIELPELAAWVPAQPAQVAQISGVPVSGVSGVPLLMKDKFFG